MPSPTSPIACRTTRARASSVLATLTASLTRFLPTASTLEFRRRIYPRNRAFVRFVGTELVLGTAWQATRHISLSAAYSHFFAGQFIHQNGGSDASFVAVWSTFRF